MIKFPASDTADKDGFLAWSLEISPDYLIAAYREGIFPWPVDDESVLWFSPPERAILFFDKVSVHKRTQRSFRHRKFSLRINHCFDEIIRNCSEVPRKNQPGTWITPKLKQAYSEFHRMGYAMSFEAWTPDGRLAGGMYGVKIGRYFSGESMFHFEPDASKFALLSAVEYLKGEGVTWLDAQVASPLLLEMGAVNLPREEFLEMLKESLK